VKLTFVGGGSGRTLPIVRAAMGWPGILAGGEIRLYDLNLERAETVGRLIQRTPEFAANPCRVTWTRDADTALAGADVVSLSMPIGSLRATTRAEEASYRHGFFSSDQMSLDGAFRSLIGGTIVLDIARRMERLCPTAWLVDFANPVAVYSGMVNNHTRIRALGICGGFTNHRWDLPRICGRDAYDDSMAVATAGVNHLSFILRGTWHGRDLFDVLREHAGPGWRPPRITSISSPHQRRSIAFALRKLVWLLRRHGTVIFSTEGDGMAHLFFEEMYGTLYRPPRTLSARALAAAEQASQRASVERDRDLRSYLDRDLGADFWAQTRDSRFAPNPQDLTVTVLKALAGVSRETIAASRPNRGAVRGFKDRTVLEYSMTLDRDGVTPLPDLEVPDVYQPVITALATHQTLLGDAVATGDPRLFADALACYPLQPGSRQARALCRDLLRIYAAEIPAVFQGTADYLR
jgi:6-phospho-beta-glucosidase